jgi:arsenite methyltransferase
MALRSTSLVDTIRSESSSDMSLFERFPGLYAFFRERLFRDDTERIVESLWPDMPPVLGSTLIELGCGPGFYARRLAERFPSLNVVGIDRSAEQLALANERAAPHRHPNCRFERGEAESISFAGGSVDAVVASRLITVLREPDRAIAEIHRVLRPGGRCFIAEPRPHPVARLPLSLMWAVADVSRLLRRSEVHYREPVAPMLLETSEFAALMASQPWADARVWSDGRYQYALCSR